MPKFISFRLNHRCALWKWANSSSSSPAFEFCWEWSFLFHLPPPALTMRIFFHFQVIAAKRQTHCNGNFCTCDQLSTCNRSCRNLVFAKTFDWKVQFIAHLLFLFVLSTSKHAEYLLWRSLGKLLRMKVESCYKFAFLNYISDTSCWQSPFPNAKYRFTYFHRGMCDFLSTTVSTTDASNKSQFNFSSSVDNENKNASFSSAQTLVSLEKFFFFVGNWKIISVDVLEHRYMYPKMYILFYLILRDCQLICNFAVFFVYFWFLRRKIKDVLVLSLTF